MLVKMAVRSPFRSFFRWQKRKPLKHFCSRGFCQGQAIPSEAESVAQQTMDYWTWG